MPLPRLVTERLLLRPFTREDEEVHELVFADPEVAGSFCRTTRTLEQVRDWLVHRWGDGYATEAGRALVAHAFETLRLPRIAYGVDGANARSVGVMRRLGFRLERNLHPDDDDSVVGVLDNDRA